MPIEKHSSTEVTAVTFPDSLDCSGCAALDSEERGYLNWPEVDLFPEETIDARRSQPQSCFERVWEWLLDRVESYPRVDIFLRESRSYLRRMRSELGTTTDVSLNYGPCWEHEAQGNPVPCRYTQTRMRDIGKALADRGWGTSLDERF